MYLGLFCIAEGVNRPIFRTGRSESLRLAAYVLGADLPPVPSLLDVLSE